MQHFRRDRDEVNCLSAFAFGPPRLRPRGLSMESYPADGARLGDAAPALEGDGIASRLLLEDLIVYNALESALIESRAFLAKEDARSRPSAPRSCRRAGLRVRCAHSQPGTVSLTSLRGAPTLAGDSPGGAPRRLRRCRFPGVQRSRRPALRLPSRTALAPLPCHLRQLDQTRGPRAPAPHGMRCLRSPMPRTTSSRAAS